MPLSNRQAYERPSTAAPRRQAPAACCQRQEATRRYSRARARARHPATCIADANLLPAPRAVRQATRETEQSLRLVVHVVRARDVDACRQRLVTGERHGRVQGVMGNVPGPGPAQGIRHRGLALAKRRPAKKQTVPERKKGGRLDWAPALFRCTKPCSTPAPHQR